MQTTSDSYKHRTENSALTERSKTQRKKTTLDGAYTFASSDNLASQFVDIYLDLRNVNPSETYRLYLNFSFLDSNAKKIVVRFIQILSEISKRDSFPTLVLKYFYCWNDDDMEEYGQILSEVSGENFSLVQIDDSNNLTVG